MMATFSAFLLLLAAAQPAEAEEPLVVRDAVFYALDNRGGGEPEVRPTTTIPLRVGQCYGWMVLVEPQPRTLTIREVFELPDAGNWNTGDQTSAVTRNNRTAVTQFEAPLNDGVITHGWCVAAGDPAGRHRIRVYHGERLLREFRFTVTSETR
jgi:hypothetical protein